MDHEGLVLGLVFDGGFDLGVEGADGVFGLYEGDAIAGDGAAFDADDKTREEAPAIRTDDAD